MIGSKYPRDSSRAPQALSPATVALVVLLGMISSAVASPGDTELVSIGTMSGVIGNGDRPVSADGRFVTFTSAASES